MIIHWFQADVPGKFEVRRGSEVLELVTWEKDDTVLVLSDGTRTVIRGK
jgi:hypothetical protein